MEVSRHKGVPFFECPCNKNHIMLGFFREIVLEMCPSHFAFLTIHVDYGNQRFARV